jgi:hypothetical protein
MTEKKSYTLEQYAAVCRIRLDNARRRGDLLVAHRIEEALKSLLDVARFNASRHGADPDEAAHAVMECDPSKLGELPDIPAAAWGDTRTL